MWTLPLPCNANSIAELQTALTYKDGTAKHALTGEEITKIRGIYQKYEDVGGKPDQVLKADGLLNDSTLDAIHEGYNEVQEKKRLNHLRSRLMLATDRCPCCSIGTVTDLDHHLPHSSYKAISVYSSNLVPLCHTCNNKKRTVAGTAPEERFAHVYYDAIPTDKRFLIAHTEIVDGALLVSFDIEKVDEMSDDVYKMVKFQIARIELDKRLQKEVNSFLCSYATNLQTAFSGNSDPKIIKQILLDNEQHFAKQMGLNDWRCALLSSLAHNNEFCDGGFQKALGLTE